MGMSIDTVPGLEQPKTTSPHLKIALFLAPNKSLFTEDNKDNKDGHENSRTIGHAMASLFSLYSSVKFCHPHAPLGFLVPTIAP
jgi:hypothetical protein